MISWVTMADNLPPDDPDPDPEPQPGAEPRD